MSNFIDHFLIPSAGSSFLNLSAYCPVVITCVKLNFTPSDGSLARTCNFRERHLGAPRHHRMSRDMYFSSDNRRQVNSLVALRKSIFLRRSWSLHPQETDVSTLIILSLLCETQAFHIKGRLFVDLALRSPSVDQSPERPSPIPTTSRYD
jgi:hypothetical protein